MRVFGLGLVGAAILLACPVALADPPDQPVAAQQTTTSAQSPPAQQPPGAPSETVVVHWDGASAGHDPGPSE